MRWTVAFMWGLCACQIVGPRPPMVHDGMPPEAFKSAQFILVKGELLEQQVAVVGAQGSVREVTVGDVRAKFERLEGDEIIVQGPRGLMSTELSEVTAVTFTGPEIRRWKANRLATVFGATTGAVVGLGALSVLVLDNDLSMRSDLAPLVVFAPLAVGFYAGLGSAVGFVVGSLGSGEVTLSTDQGWVPVVPPSQ